MMAAKMVMECRFTLLTIKKSSEKRRVWLAHKKQDAPKFRLEEVNCDPDGAALRMT